MTPPRSLSIRTLWLVAGLLCPLAACSDFTGVEDISDGPTPPAADEAAPSITLQDASSTFEAGDALMATLEDDGGVRRAAAFVLAPEDPEVLWASDTLTLNLPTSRKVSFTVEDLPSDFPYGETVRFTVWASDGAGNAAYAPGGSGDSGISGTGNDTTSTGGSDGAGGSSGADAPDTLDEAETKPLTVYQGRTFTLGEGAEIGDIAFNPVHDDIYFSVTTANAIRTLDVERRTVVDERIAVGSRPTLLTVDPTNFGPGPTLIVYNSGGTEVSVVDLSADGGTERTRVVLPLINLKVGSEEELQLRRDAHTITVQCPTINCFDPTLFIGSSALGTSGRGATRSLKITDPNQLADFDVITPEFRDFLPRDEEVGVEASVTDPETARDSVLFQRNGRSKCGTLAFGSPVVATADERGAPLFISETGEAFGACAGANVNARVFRLSREGGSFFIEAASVVNFDRDDEIRNVQALDVNADGTLVLLRTSRSVLIADGYLRRLGTLPLEGASAATLLEGQSDGAGSIGRGGLIAVSQDQQVFLYETQHFTRVATFHLAHAIRQDDLLFVRTDDRGGLMVVGITMDGQGLTRVETSIAELLAARD